MSDTAIAIINNGLDTKEFKKTHSELIKFVKGTLRESKDIKNGTTGDYGTIPFTKKVSLLKPGAEKLLKLFGFSAHMEKVKEIEDFENKFVFYKYRCTITHTATGTYIADAVRSANNKEKQVVASGSDVYNAANTVEAKAQKRALVAATVQATMASEIFDADLSDFDEEAPERKVTKEEDPKRNQISMRLYGVMKEHGWSDKWVHTAILKRWSVDSITKISNDQMNELIEFITTTYLPVKAGEKPQQRVKAVEVPVVDPETEKAKEEIKEVIAKVEEGEIVESFCRQCKKTGLGEEQYFCDDECQKKYYDGMKPPSKAVKNNFKFDSMIKKEDVSK